MKQSLLRAAVCACVLLIAPPAHADHVAFPPDNCNAFSPFMSFNGTDNGGNTYCSDGQTVFLNALPNCTEGQTIVKRGDSFTCEDQTVSSSVLPNCTDGQTLVKRGNSFICEDSIVLVQKRCVVTAGDGANGTECTALCDPGFVVVGGGCSSDGTQNECGTTRSASSCPYGAHAGYDTRTYVTGSEPTADYKGWYCHVIEEGDLPSNLKTVANGYATCMKVAGTH